MSKTGWAVGLVLAASVAGTGFYLKNGKKEGPRFRMEKLEKGDVVSTVSATGALSAVTTVKVGSQVSGIIARLLVDFNSPVKKGQLLAELDPTPFQQSVAQRRADLEKNKVELRNAEISAKFELPMCQDTGTALVLAKKGQRVWTGADDAAYLSKGIRKTPCTRS